jgi:glycerol-3-phosphate dehydrogenase (NAD(P)+)
MIDVTTIGVVGAGAWGTALAIIANRTGSRTILWSRNPAVVNSIAQSRVNQVYLPDVFVDPDIRVVSDLSELRGVQYLILAVPAQQMRSVLITLADLIGIEIPLVIACKGIERGSLMLMHEVVQSVLPHNPVLVLSGPNFAVEVAKGLPAATAVAGASEEIANQLIYTIGGKYFRPYYTDDVIATEVAGAVKNVIAIACGMAMGKQYGDNARAALMTRGLAEMMRLTEAKGGRRESLMGLAGVGDLFLTCSSTQSRNFALGMQVATQTMPSSSSLTEGVATAESVAALAARLNISMPLCSMVNNVLQNKFNLDKAIQSLLNRPFVMDVERSSLNLQKTPPFPTL